MPRGLKGPRALISHFWTGYLKVLNIFFVIQAGVIKGCLTKIKVLHHQSTTITCIQAHMPTTTCQISCTELVQRVSKIPTPHRLLRDWFAMAHFEAEIQRFSNMLDKEGSM